VSPGGSAPPPESPSARVPSIFLVGFRGSGKSTVGHLLARRLSRAFVDTDRLVEEAAGKSIARIFSDDGEPAFRALETSALERVCLRVEAGEPIVAATGGGIVLAESNRKRMRSAGVVAWLHASAPTLSRRIALDPASESTRPALRPGGTSASEVAELLRIREPLYRDAASIEARADELSPEEVADRILSQLATPERSGRERGNA
jgi:shikimate kinase